MGEAVILYCLACGWQSEPEAQLSPTPYCGFCDAPLRHFVKYEAGVEDAAAKAAVAEHLSSAGGWMLKSMLRRVGAEPGNKMPKANAADIPNVARRED